MAEKKIAIPKEKAHGTCHPTMSAWRLSKASANKGGAPGIAGRRKGKLHRPPAEGWVAGKNC